MVQGWWNHLWPGKGGTFGHLPGSGAWEQRKISIIITGFGYLLLSLFMHMSLCVCLSHLLLHVYNCVCTFSFLLMYVFFSPRVTCHSFSLWKWIYMDVLLFAFMFHSAWTAPFDQPINFSLSKPCVHLSSWVCSFIFLGLVWEFCISIYPYFCLWLDISQLILLY